VNKLYPTRILFISHSYPPIVGGVETHNFGLFTSLSIISDCTLIANTNRILIPVFMFYATLRALFGIQKYDIVLLGSGLLGITGWIVKKLTGKPVVAVIHGLDITYNRLIYKKLWVRRFIPSLDKLIAVGKSTVKAGIDRGIPKDKFVFIPNGINIHKHYISYSRHKLENIIKIGITRKSVLLTSGRLVKRKGIAWFIQNVLPKLDDSVIYVIAGDGPEKRNIISLISETGQKNRVFMLGRISDQVRDILFNTCDIFVQPNIMISGDIEGFGISALEAASYKMPVVASRLEGLQDAIKDGENGFLVEPENSDKYVLKIMELLGNKNFRKSFGEKARQYVIDNYQWREIAIRYAEELKRLI